MIDGEELALAIGTVSILSSNPLSLAARFSQGEPFQMTNSLLRSRLVYMDVLVETHWWEC